MTTEDTTNDSTDIENDTDPTETEQADVSRRRFIQGAATSIAGLGAAGALSGSAEASQLDKRVIVVGRGNGRHSYEIQMRDNGRIRKANHAGSNDTIGKSDGQQRADGEVWHWNADSYAYTGDIDSVEGNGDMSFHFLHGAFWHDDRIVVGSQSGADKRYSMGTVRGDIDLVPKTTASPKDGDDKPGNGYEYDEFSAKSERHWTPDKVSGGVGGGGEDTHTIGGNDSVQYLRLKGHIIVNPYGAASGGSGGNKEASILFHYMGDSEFTTFFQNVPDLREPLYEYDRKILLKHSDQSDGLSAGAHELADEVHEPTRGNFESCIEKLTEQGYTIDLTIVSHGRRDSFKMSQGEFGSADYYDAGDIERLRASLGRDAPLRLVHQVNCWGRELNESWRQLGATTAFGSRYVNFFPNQFTTFAKRWRKGDTVREALKRANSASSRSLVKYGLRWDMKFTKGGQWARDPGKRLTCTPGIVYNTGGGCAKDYFVNRWRHTDEEWNSTNATGWQFMQFASKKHVAGDDSITR